MRKQNLYLLKKKVSKFKTRAEIQIQDDGRL